MRDATLQTRKINLRFERIISRNRRRWYPRGSQVSGNPEFGGVVHKARYHKRGAPTGCPSACTFRLELSLNVNLYLEPGLRLLLLGLEGGPHISFTFEGVQGLLVPVNMQIRSILVCAALYMCRS